MSEKNTDPASALGWVGGYPKVAAILIYRYPDILAYATLARLPEDLGK